MRQHSGSCFFYHASGCFTGWVYRMWIATQSAGQTFLVCAMLCMCSETGACVIQVAGICSQRSITNLWPKRIYVHMILFVEVSVLRFTQDIQARGSSVL